MAERELLQFRELINGNKLLMADGTPPISNRQATGAIVCHPGEGLRRNESRLTQLRDAVGSEVQVYSSTP